MGVFEKIVKEKKITDDDLTNIIGIGSFNIDRQHNHKMCNICGEKEDLTSLDTGSSWSGAAYCGSCKTISYMTFPDDMSGNHTLSTKFYKGNVDIAAAKRWAKAFTEVFGNISKK